MTEGKLEFDRGLLVKAMELARAQGARYADVRVETSVSEVAQAENGAIKNVTKGAGTTLGVRALAGGTWGFASMDIADDDGLKGVLDVCVGRAVRHAKAQARFPEIKLAKVRPARTRIKARMKREPISLKAKIDLSKEVTRSAKAMDTVVMALASIYHVDSAHHFCSTEGALITQERMRVGGEVMVNAHSKGSSQTYWKPFGAFGGWEFIERADPVTLGLRVANTCRKLVTEAKVPKSELTTVVTRPDFNMLKVHEIVGHPVEGDRVLGGESAWAGRAWWQDLRGKRVASELVTAVSDARPTRRHDGFYGTFHYDDEGVPAQRVVHIDKGILKDFLHSRQTAHMARARPSGAMRANHAGLMPIIRMTNTYFEHDRHGPNTFEECIEDIKDGVVLGHQSIPSIDSRRFRFQISAYEAWKVKKGEIVGMLKNTALMGTTPEYLRSIYRVGGPRTWELFQVPNCGKGDPMQIMRVGNGGPIMVGTARIIGGA
jgi:TldD protein